MRTKSGAGETAVVTFVNPIDLSGDDPYVVKNGTSYYYCYSVGVGVAVNSIGSIGAITKNGGKTVYIAPKGTKYSFEYWAPELHYIDGEWYIYVAADDGDNFSHRMYVLKGTSQDPTEPFEFVGELGGDNDRWAIDGTVLQYKGELYFIWSGWAGTENVAQNIYIAHMSDPAAMDSERVLLSRPEYDWETVGKPLINEGPAVLVKGDAVHIVYSASGSWCDDYCLGILTCRGGDLLNAAAWVKGSEPILSKAEGSYGPGHCTFVEAADGATFVVYHANLKSGTGWAGRSVRAQPVGWNGDMPLIGAPAKPGAAIEVTNYK